MAIGSVRRNSQHRPASQNGVFAVAACAIACALTSRAFTLGPVQSPSPGTAVTHGGKIASARPSQEFLPHAMKAMDAGSKAWRAAGFAALILASACRALTPKNSKGFHRGGRKSGHRFVVHVAPAASLLSPSRSQAPAVCTNARQTEAPEVNVSVDIMHIAPVVPEVVPGYPAAAASVVTSFAPRAEFIAGSVPEVSATTTTPKLRGAEARRVGSARCRSARRASSSAGQDQAAKTARRSMGARLQDARQPSITVPPSFDSSRLRSPLQVGLRYSSHVSAAVAREMKSPSATVGAANSMWIFLQGGRCASMVKDRQNHSSSMSLRLSPCSLLSRER